MKSYFALGPVSATAQCCSSVCDPVQAEESCKKYGAAEVKSIIADLTDAKEAQRLGEVCPLALSGAHVTAISTHA